MNTNSLKLHVFGLSAETGEPGGADKNMQTPRIQKWRCESTPHPWSRAPFTEPQYCSAAPS